MSVPTRLMACSSRFFGSPLTAFLCSSMMTFACAGVDTPHMRLKVFMLKGMLYISPLKLATGLLV